MFAHIKNLDSSKDSNNFANQQQSKKGTGTNIDANLEQMDQNTQTENPQMDSDNGILLTSEGLEYDSTLEMGNVQGGNQTNTQYPNSMLTGSPQNNQMQPQMNGPQPMQMQNPMPTLNQQQSVFQGMQPQQMQPQGNPFTNFNHQPNMLPPVTSPISGGMNNQNAPMQQIAPSQVKVLSME